MAKRMHLTPWVERMQEAARKSAMRLAQQMADASGIPSAARGAVIRTEYAGNAVHVHVSLPDAAGVQTYRPYASAILKDELLRAISREKEGLT